MRLRPIPHRELCEPGAVGPIVQSDRRHRFGLAPPELWARMGQVDRYRSWWPWLRELDAEGLCTGDVWTCVVQPPLPYRLRFDLTLDEVIPERSVAATVRGDIEGSASFEINGVAGGSELHLASALAPRHPVLRAMGTVAHPIARFGHDWVLDTGLRQFRDRVG